MSTGQSAQNAKEQRNELEWHPELLALGYKPPLPPPIPAIQATLSAIQNSEIHDFVKQSDLAAIEAADEESESAVLLLTILDLSLWTRVFEFANSPILIERQKALDRLREFNELLPKLVAQDFEESEQADKNMRAAEAVLQLANPKANPDAEKGLGLASHSFLMNLTIDNLNKVALEDFEDAITNSQCETEQSTLIPSGKRTVIPFKPARAVEDAVSQTDHNCGKLGNSNLAAPIASSTWCIWADLKAAEIVECREQALWAVLQLAKNPIDECIILPGLLEAGPRLIERHIKSKAFSLKNPKIPSLGPPSKKQKINLNTTPNSGQVSTYGKNAATSSNYGRGGRKMGGRYGGRNQSARGGYTGRGRGSMNQSGRSDRNSGNQYRDTRVLVPGQKVCGMFAHLARGKNQCTSRLQRRKARTHRGTQACWIFWINNLYAKLYWQSLCYSA